MTPDESAWTVFIAELRRRDLLNIAGAASAALAELRRAELRRASGAFGPELRQKQTALPSQLDAMRAQLEEIQRDRDDSVERGLEWNRQLQHAARERDEARVGLDQQTKRAFSAEQERDAVWRDARNFQEQRDVNLALLQAARSRAEAAEKAARSAEARADASFREKTAVAALLKEALGALAVVANMPAQPLHGLVYVVDPVTRGQAIDVLAKAKAAGYVP